MHVEINTSFYIIIDRIWYLC